MKHYILIVFLVYSTISFSQKKVVKTFETQLQEIQISTAGLDDFVIENTDSNFIEVILFAEDVNEQYIYFTPKGATLQIGFRTENLENQNTVFRKFITKRLQRASAIIKIPKGKKVLVFGENINIESKIFLHELSIYIDKGIVKLNKVQADFLIKMYSGNVYADVKNAKIKVSSNLGKIVVDSISYSKIFENKLLNSRINFTVVAIKANVFLNTK